MATNGRDEYILDDQPDLASGRLSPRLSSADPDEKGVTSKDDEFGMSMDRLDVAAYPRGRERGAGPPSTNGISGRILPFATGVDEANSQQ
jgi:hypothetical protein